MAIHGTILARERSARSGANAVCNGTNAVCTGTSAVCNGTNAVCTGTSAVCNGTSWNSSSRFSTNSTRVTRAARTQSAHITVLLVL